MKRNTIIISSGTGIPLDTYLLLLCEMMNTVTEEDAPTPHQEPSADAA